MVPKRFLSGLQTVCVMVQYERNANAGNTNAVLIQYVNKIKGRLKDGTNGGTKVKKLVLCILWHIGRNYHDDSGNGRTQAGTWLYE